MSLDSQCGHVDLEMPWSTVGYAHWKAQCPEPCVRHCLDGDRVGPNDRMYLSTVASRGDALPETDDGTHQRYPLGLETQQLSQVRSALMAERPHRTVEHWCIPQAQMNVLSALHH